MGMYHVCSGIISNEYRGIAVARLKIERMKTEWMQANSASGMAVDDDCKLKFLDLKAKRNYRFITYKIEDYKVMVDKLGGPDESYDAFKSSLPSDECRYAVFDFDFTTNENVQKSKIFFIAWYFFIYIIF